MTRVLLKYGGCNAPLPHPQHVSFEMFPKKSRKLFTFVSNELSARHLTPDHHFHFHPLISFLAQEFSKSAAVDLDRFLPSEKPYDDILLVIKAKKVLIEFMVSPQLCPDTPSCDGDNVLSRLQGVVQVLPAGSMSRGNSVRALHHVQPGQVRWHTGVLQCRKVKQGVLIASSPGTI